MALYETAEEMREIVIDAFDRQTGRGDFLRKLAVAGGVALAGGATSALAAELTPGETRTGIPNSDIDILNYALTLEHIEATFYRTTMRPSGMTAMGRQIAQYVDILAADEKAHVDALTAVITQAGKTPVKEAKYTVVPRPA